MLKLAEIYSTLLESDENLSKAFDEVKQLGIPHPFMRGSIWFDEYEATLDVSKFDGLIWIGSLIINEDQRGKGHASKIMKDILQIADKYKVSVGLSPEPFGATKTMSKGKLTSWYKRLGFKQNRDRLIYSPKN